MTLLAKLERRRLELLGRMAAARAHGREDLWRELLRDLDDLDRRITALRGRHNPRQRAWRKPRAGILGGRRVEPGQKWGNISAAEWEAEKLAEALARWNSPDGLTDAQRRSREQARRIEASWRRNNPDEQLPMFFTDERGVIHPVRATLEAAGKYEPAEDRQPPARGDGRRLVKSEHREQLRDAGTAPAYEENDYERRQREKRERLAARAAKTMSSAEQLLDRAHRMADVIPFGQPILVGHHSEGRDRRYRDKIDRTYRKAFDEYHHAQSLQTRADHPSTAISSDDPAAVRKLQEKLAQLEAEHAEMKAVNAAHARYLKDRASLDRTSFSEKRKELIRNYKPVYSWEPHPIAPYSLTNSGANIRNVKERIEQLRRRPTETVTREVPAAGGITVVEDADDNRIQLQFPGKPSDAARAILKRHGWRWSPTRGAWVRGLNNAGRWSAEQVIEAIGGLERENPSRLEPRRLQPSRDAGDLLLGGLAAATAIWLFTGEHHPR